MASQAEQKSLILWTITMTALAVIVLWATFLVRGALLLIYVSILLAIGFPQNAKPGQVSEGVVSNLGLTYLFVLGGLYGAAILCVSLYRITRDSHAASLAKLAAQAEQVEGGEGPERIG